MPKILASIKNLKEVKLIINTDIDIIDLKDPSNGALGKLNDNDIKIITEYVNKKKLTSSTIGDLPNDVELISKNVKKISATQVDFIKIGVYDPKYINTLCSLNSLKKLIAVFFADKFLPDENDLKKIKDSGFYGVMIDTSNKNAGNVFDHTSINNLNIFIKKSEKLKLLTGIAGSVNETHIDKLIRLNPNYVGFRGALCENKNIRASSISKKNVINIINLVNHSKNLSISA